MSYGSTARTILTGPNNPERIRGVFLVNFLMFVSVSLSLRGND